MKRVFFSFFFIFFLKEAFVIKILNLISRVKGKKIQNWPIICHTKYPWEATLKESTLSCRGSNSSSSSSSTSSSISSSISRSSRRSSSISIVSSSSSSSSSSSRRRRRRRTSSGSSGSSIIINSSSSSNSCRYCCFCKLSPWLRLRNNLYVWTDISSHINPSADPILSQLHPSHTYPQYHF